MNTSVEAPQQDSSDNPQRDDADNPLRVLIEDGVVMLVESGTTVELRHYARSKTIMAIPGDAEAGTSVLPVTRNGIRLWQEAVDSLLITEIWHLHRAMELSLVSQVSEYLNDQETLEWAIKRLAQAVDSAVRAKFRALYNQRYNSDAAFWRQMLRPRDMATGAQFSKIADTERNVVRLSESDPRMCDADHHLLSSCQALVDLPLTLQTQALSLVALPLCVLVPQLPDDLLPALLRRHLYHGSLDISNQFKILESDTQYTRGMRELVKKLPFKTLTPELQSLRPLRSLNVSDNNLVLADAAPLATFFESCTTELQTLSLSKNANLKFAAAVLPALTACTALTCLNLSGCRFPQSCAVPLCAVLRAVHGLRRLVLNDCIQMPLEQLAEPLGSLTALTSLSMRENQFSIGFTALARALHGLEALQELDLSGSAPHLDSLACVVASAVRLPELRNLRLDNLLVSIEGPSIEAMCDLSSKVQDWLKLYRIEVPETPNSSSGGVPSVDGSVLVHCEHACVDGDDKLAEGSDCGDSAPPDFKSLRFPLKRLHLSHMHGIAVDWLMAIATAQLAWKSNRLRNVGSTFIPWRAAVSPPLWEVVQAENSPDVSQNAQWCLVAMLENLEFLDISHPEYSFRYPYTGGGPNWSCEFIFQLPKLQELRARNLDVKHRSFALSELSDGLADRLTQKQISGLTALDCSQNSITLGDLRAVCSVSSLNRLVLKSCGVGVEGATVLAEHVTQLTVLHTLDLSGNELKGAGVSALLHGVSGLESLRVVDVGGGSGVVQAVSELKNEGVIGSSVLVSCTVGQRT